MTFHIRAGNIHDAARLQEIIALSLGDADTDISQIQKVLASDKHCVSVSVVDDLVAGFACGFSTPAKNGDYRHQLDLLGVHPDFHGQGMGRELVQSTTQFGMQPGIIFSRGLIRVDNIASQKAFTYAGYTLLPDNQYLYVSDSDVYAEIPLPDDTPLIPVETLTYRGVWMEGKISSAGIAAAQSLKTRGNRDNSGAVVAASDTDSIHALKTADYILIGTYQWWQFLPE